MAEKRISKFTKKDPESSVHSSAKSLSPIKLMKPETDKGKSVLKALQLRKTVREISDKKISLQVLSNLLWAACGVNRKKGPFGIPGRTAATASNSQEIDLYVALKEGTYHYDPFKHYLIPVAAGDLRAMAIGRGQVNFGNKAPVRLIYVADIDRLIHTPGYQEPGLLNTEIQKSYYYVDT
ncbi:MAG TPA: nitroreductase family protein, partial [Bacteroidales bacterium]|nr:nitroreductase family protein [Bacteroidales bacterium]